MNKEQLIAKQQLEIESLKEINGSMNKTLDEIMKFCVCIGGPLNDSKKCYSRAQISDWWAIYNAAEQAVNEQEI